MAQGERQKVRKILLKKSPYLSFIVIITMILLNLVSVSGSFKYRRPGPYFDINVQSDADEIWPEKTGKKPDTSTINVSFTAKGDEALIFNPQDSMLVLDCSQSMIGSDPNQTLLQSTKNYVDNMNYPDRSGIIKMSSNSTIIQNLTNDYQTIKNKLDLSIEPGGRTDLEKSLKLAVNELKKQGEPKKERVILLLSDGKATDNLTRNTIDEIEENNLKIYTVGFGNEINTDLLRWLANKTEGKFYHIHNSNNLVRTYLDISNREYTDATGKNLSIKINFHDYIDVDLNSFTLPPSNITTEQGNTNVTWELNSTFYLGDKWNVKFNISTEMKGLQSIYTNESGIYYTKPWDNFENFTPLPNYNIKGKIKDVYLLPPPPPPPASATPPPVEAFPMPTSPMATTTIVPQASLQPIAQTAGYQALFAPLLGLGVGEVLKGKMKTEQKSGISMSSGKKPEDKVEKKDVETLGYTFNER
ncbi:MAG: vWA domain-containing protein [Thermoplasmata archaeon]